MKKINKGLVRIGSLVLVLALVLLVAIPAFADGSTSAPATTPPLHTLQGTVLSINNTSTNGSFVIQNASQQQVTINTDSNTKYYLINMGRAQNYVNGIVSRDNRVAQRNGRPMPPRANDLRNAHIPANWRDNLGWLDTFNKQAGFSDIQVGDRVIVRATTDGNNLAKQVLIIKAPVNKVIKGTATLTDANHITITPTTGSAVTLNVTSATRIVLRGQTSISGNAVAVYNSTNDNALTISIQAGQ